MGLGWVSVGFSWFLRGCHAVFSHKQQGKPAIGWDTKANAASSQEPGWALGGFCMGLASHPRSPTTLTGQFRDFTIVRLFRCDHPRNRRSPLMS